MIINYYHYNSSLWYISLIINVTVFLFLVLFLFFLTGKSYLYFMLDVVIFYDLCVWMAFFKTCYICAALPYPPWYAFCLFFCLVLSVRPFLLSSKIWDELAEFENWHQKEYEPNYIWKQKGHEFFGFHNHKQS